MDGIIKTLVQTHSRVNIPGFGAFIISKDNESFSVLFNRHLNYDDGVLSGYLVDTQGITQDEAKDQIKQYVDKLNTALEAGKASIDGIGSFTMDGARVEFALDPDFHLGDATEQQSNEPLNISPMNNQTSEDNSPKFEEPKFEEPKFEERQEESVEQQPAEETVEDQDFNVEEQKKRPTIFWVILIVILLLIALFLCLFVINKDNAIYNFFFPPKVEVIEQPIVPIDTVKVDTVVVEPEPVDTIPEKSYNIVVGTYTTEAGAQGKVDWLKQKGFESAKVDMFRGKYVAIIESHSNLVEAEARQEYIVDTYRIESYITNGGE